MSISLDQIKSLREKTGISSTNCKKALEETNGDEEKAIQLLRKKGQLKARERSQRTTSEGAIISYIHTNNKIGVLLELACETDFVARNEEFLNLGKDLVMHIAAMNPLYLLSENVPPELVEKEIEIWKEQLSREGKPEKIWETIIEGKTKKFKEEISLLGQPFVKNPDITVEKHVNQYITKLGENIQVKRFTRYSM